MRTRSTALASSVALVSLLALSCATSGVNSGDFNLISLDEEWQLGAQLERDMSKQVKLVRNGRAADYLNRVGARRSSARPSCAIANGPSTWWTIPRSTRSTSPAATST